MTLTRSTHLKEENSQANPQSETHLSTETEQILHLKRLLVTLKQHYEKNLQTTHIQLQAEQNQKIALQKELDSTQAELADSQKHHEEELAALRHQQTVLKDLLKKTQDELKQLRADPQSHHQPTGKDSFLSRNRNKEIYLETKQLREELDQAHKRTKSLEQELVESKQKAQQELTQLQQLAASHSLETTDTNTSQLLRQELENIKQTLVQGTQETKALEARYVEVLNEKIDLEHQFKQLHIQFDHQSSNLTAFQTKLHQIEQQKKKLENQVYVKESELNEKTKQLQELQQQAQQLKEWKQEKEFIQDKYEQLKDEWMQVTEQLEEALNIRSQAEQQLAQLESLAQEQRLHLQEHTHQVLSLDQDKQILLLECQQLKNLLEDSEARLKVAQQHLAKKVKEAALLNEKLEEHQSQLIDLEQIAEHQKTELSQLHAHADLYQKQEKRLQEQLHEALKGTESQVAKWEEKYFRMYDKWQESETRIRELKKFEEKHQQMQSLLANLGTFMGTSFNSAGALFSAGQEGNRLNAIENENASQAIPKTDPSEERYDLFGMRQPIEKYKSPHSHE